MKTFTAVYFLFVVFLLSGCLPSDRQPDGKPTDIIPTDTAIPTAKPSFTATITATGTPNPNFISASSPDNKYFVELRLAEVPIKLVVMDLDSKRETEILLTHRYYNRIIGGDSAGFRWTTDNKILMFVLYQEPSPERMADDFSSFLVIDVSKATLLTINYSSMFRGIRYEEESKMTVLEHGGLNDINDYYFPGINCYKGYFFGECEKSYISPSGDWELSQWEPDVDIRLIGLSGAKWEFSYSKLISDSGYLISSVQHWTADGKYVFFSPGRGYGTPKVYGLFRMDLTNGNVMPLIGSGYLADEYFYYLSVSTDAKKFIYVTTDKRLVIKDLENNTKKESRISVSASENVSNFVWSPDETKVVFAKLTEDQDYNVISADYLMLDVETGQIITLLEDESKYLNVKEMTNSKVLLDEKLFSLVDGKIILTSEP